MIAKIQKIEDVDGVPEVGKFYNVPCVLNLEVPAWVPVLGPRHEDAEYIGFKHEHYHFDFRFISDEVLRSTIGTANHIRKFGVVAYEGGEKKKWDISRVVRKIRKCQRLMDIFPREYSSWLTRNREVPWLADLERAYESKQLKCMTCPHRGISLKGVPAVDGKVVCPGHGLQWDVVTGKMVRRTAEGM